MTEMNTPDLHAMRRRVRVWASREEQAVLADLMSTCPVSTEIRASAGIRATGLVTGIRQQKNPGLMEVFLAEYGLSTAEGIALMCLAEALLRVPDAETVDTLIEDKIAPSRWSEHLGNSSSPLVNASTWALMLTGKVLDTGESASNILHNAVKRLGEPVIRLAVKRAMKELGAQFVLGETIEEAFNRGSKQAAHGYTFSFDMLGEAALTVKDATSFFTAYADAITKLAPFCRSPDIRDNPGISVKLSALHPRYEYAQKDRVIRELVPRVLDLARMARQAGMGFNIDAEEADRLDLSLDVIEAVLPDAELAGWEGFGVVVQAYGKRAKPVIDWLYALAQTLDRRIMVRFVKGAYWDTEIKRAQVEGLGGFPVFECKVATDISYLCCAKHLLSLTDRIYPQFATHNAHSVATILAFGEDPGTYEFQRLHGMGEALHDQVIASNQARSRIYAPVGEHRDLLAYLVRRLLENGANSSFVNQIVDESVPVETVIADPFERLSETKSVVQHPCDLFVPERTNSAGLDLLDPIEADSFEAMRRAFRTARWDAKPLLAIEAMGGSEQSVQNPANPDDIVGSVTLCSTVDVDSALVAATSWNVSSNERAATLRRASDLYEENRGELFAILCREAGKSPADAIAEVREAVDFLRYYAARGEELSGPPRGTISCISPWNFPLAIFTGQIAAALAAGNAVLAKPAEPTAIIAFRAVELLHQAGVPKTALQLLPGRGSVVGTRLTGDPSVNGVCFTGSTATAQTIHRTMAETVEPTAPLVAETGGLNAMIVDSTALPEQAIKDIVASAFQSAGQRCSALRMLYLQEDVAVPFQDMLFGAMDELTLGDPWHHQTDVGPIINEGALQDIVAHIEQAKVNGRLLKSLRVPERGFFAPPSVIALNGIEDLKTEIFGPVLHIATFKADELGDVVEAINGSGYGLTFGLHTRINDRVEQLSRGIHAGNIYVNRNQIGAVVGSQPFGGEGLSGTGPKAGGPRYVARFVRPQNQALSAVEGEVASFEAAQAAIQQSKPDKDALNAITLPGPTGESNRLSTYGRGSVLCLGPGADLARKQAESVRQNGCAAVAIAPQLDGPGEVSGVLAPTDLARLSDFHAVVSFEPLERLRAYRCALAARPDAIVPLLAEDDFADWCVIERHVCVDTTAAGGNAALLSEAAD
ncbi:MAG: bifunctional proline dehydrogenase/L-glutamate gamma-semialdehyde dehydrogenase PutA [Pseudomonadota bacterium]